MDVRDGICERVVVIVSVSRCETVSPDTVCDIEVDAVRVSESERVAARETVVETVSV